MDAYIAKPVEARELYEVVERAAGVGGGSRPAPARVAAGVGGEPQVFDAGRFRERYGDPELMMELIGYFQEDSAKLLEELQSAGEEGDGERLHRAAHSLKGVVGNYCADRTIQCVADLDSRAKRGELEGVEGLLVALREEMARLEEELGAFRCRLAEGLESPAPV
jgi:HPt (histidine-containing phosphotransfer) domain-containing protein